MKRSLLSVLVLASVLVPLSSCDSSNSSKDETSHPGGAEEPVTPAGTVVAPSYGIPWNNAITYGTLTDARDGQSYRTVKIGTQTWMAQNLNYRKGSGADSGWWYQGSRDSGAKYGRLYTWASLMNLDDTCNDVECASQVRPAHQGICPNGWHVPSVAEWDVLMNTVGGGDAAGAKFKSTSGWDDFSRMPGNGTDTYGFRALPGGLVEGDSSIGDCAGNYGFWWSAEETNASVAYQSDMDYRYASVGRFSSSKTVGFSARCLED